MKRILFIKPCQMGTKQSSSVDLSSEAGQVGSGQCWDLLGQIRSGQVMLGLVRSC